MVRACCAAQDAVGMGECVPGSPTRYQPIQSTSAITP